MTVRTLTTAKDQWIKLLISASQLPNRPKKGLFPAVAHPIHLHGHDFALLSQCAGTKEKPCDASEAIIKLDNPPRRDVALLPENGYLIIAFKADNPGAWLMHCHIAWHASSGLAMQILENPDKIKLHDPTKMKDVCLKWNNWYKNIRTQNPTCMAWTHFQDDSGI
jgi:hypothetical protein